MKKFLLLIGVLLFFTACSMVSDETILKAQEAAKNGALIVDVRTPKEYAQSHLEGAVNIPLKDLETRLSTLDRSKTIVVYCRSGFRASLAKSTLEEHGFKVINVATQENFRKKIEKK